ncbi:hypothetical protein IQ16_01942 [Bradyrhizobium huanghuaihaiense]|uniref:Uncharacterized protein n=2 Tax=Bradyrhizobium huanghuaihaiense TaxID=990078 RepID=A0A562RXU1_9BRAD|nr:hypothetical protein IQ16_01942 [Bradyrhizobium huanghuaihaiense]
MPILGCGDHLTVMGCYQTKVELVSVMAWPNRSDEVARHQFIASVMAANLGELQSSAEALPDPAAAADWAETIDAIYNHEEWSNALDVTRRRFDEAGSYRAVAQASGLASIEAVIRKCEKGWFSAGLILALIRRMHQNHELAGGASVNKAVHIVEKTGFPLVLRNRKDLLKAWTGYRPVAHFCAALFDAVTRSLANETAGNIEGGPLDDVMCFLGEAQAYLDFGVSYSAPRSAEKLLDPHEVWRIPEDARVNSSLRDPAPLSGKLLAAAQSYKAAIPQV